MDSLDIVIGLLVYLPFILLLIYISLKLGSKTISTLNNKNYIKVIEKVQISRENSILLVKLGEKAYVMSSSQKGIQTIKEIESKELEDIEKAKQQASDKGYMEVKALLEKIKNKGRLLK